MPLSDLREIHRFAACDARERARLALLAKASLGTEWATTTATAAEALPLIHLPTQVRFLVIPGGTFEMGLTEADIEELQLHIPWDASAIAAIEHGRAAVSPAHQVKVTPFLLAEEKLYSDQVEALSGGKHTGMYCYELTRRDAGDLAHRLGFRLPSEAEMEWVLREGGRSPFAVDGVRKLSEIGNDSESWPTRFGVKTPFETAWCADDFHPDYVGAPRTSAAWLAGEADGVAQPAGARPELVDEPEQRIGLLACWRTARGHGKAQLRLARELALE